jgi:putative copper export protein
MADLSPAFVAATAIRWVGFVALAGWVGNVALARVVLPAEISGAAPLRGRLRRWGALCLLVLAATTTAELAMRAQAMAGDGLASAIAAIPAVLQRTHFGILWIVRFLALGLALTDVALDSRLPRAARLALPLAVTLTTSLTGHAADQGDVTWSAGVDWVHVIAATAWTGGLIGLAQIVLRESSGWPGDLLGVVARRFSRLAGWCLLAVVASGGYNTWMQVVHASALWTTPYGRVLSVKLLLVLILAGWGAVNRFAVVPALTATPRRPGSDATARARLRAYVCCEAVLAIVVFACTTLLVELPPARHMRHMDHDTHAARYQGAVRGAAVCFPRSAEFEAGLPPHQQGARYG